ncbi:TAXI family TRAP transporter solute-binding subunit [Chloroflexota bacterium]
MKKTNKTMTMMAAIMAISLLAVSLLGACGTEQAPAPKPAPAPAPTPKPAPAPAPAPKPAPAPAPKPEPFKWPSGITIGTPGMRSGTYVTIAGWATEMERTTKMKVRLVPEESTALTTRWHKGKMVDFMANSQSALIDGVRAAFHRPDRQARTGGPYDVVGVMINPPSWRHWYAATDTGITSFQDIKDWITQGKKLRIARFTNVPMYYDGLEAMLGFTEDQVQYVDFNSHAATVSGVIEGHADVGYTQPEGSLAVQLEASPRGTTWLSFPDDPEAIRLYRTKFPYAGFSNVTSGVEGALGQYTIFMPGWIWGRADLDEGLAYNMTKWQLENYDLFKDKTVASALLNKESFRFNLDEMVLPVHSGSIRYLKEAGLWKAADDARQKYNLWLLERYTEAWNAAIDEADSKNITVDPSNQDWLELWKKTASEVYKVPDYALLSDDDIQARIKQYNIK